MRVLVVRIGCTLALAFGLFAAMLPAQSTSAKPGKDSAVSVDNSDTAAKTNKAKSKVGKTKAVAAKELPGITPEREAAVMTFVKRHHPALTELLIHLKENTPKEYDRAVRDLFRTSERLAQIQERDSLAYDLELQLWQARSRAQLLAARLQMADSEDLRKQLRTALTEEYDLKLQVLKRDRQKAAERLKHLSDQYDRLTQRRDEEIEKQAKQLTAAARGSEVKAKPQNKKKAENR